MTRWLLSILLLGAAPAARAQDFAQDLAQDLPQDDEGSADWGPPAPDFHGTHTTVVEWHADNRNADDTDDGYGVAVGRTQLMLEGERWRAATRLDTTLFHDAPEGTGRRNDARVERVSAGAELGLGPFRLTLDAGDFHAQIGKGLVLSLRRIDELGLDVALRGGRAELAFPGDAWTLTVLGGVTNSVNLERQRLRFVEDPDDLVLGARAEGRAGGTVLGLHGAGVRAREASAFGRDHTASFGGSVETAIDDLTVGVELDGQTRRRAGLDDRGWALYATATAPLSEAVFVLAEAKHYAEFDVMRGSASSADRLDFVYSLPPTAEPEDQELLDNTDITGGRLQLDVIVPWGESSARTSVGLFYDRRYAQWFGHAVGTLERRWASGVSAEIEVGYRREWHAAGGELSRAILIAGGDLTVPIAGDWSVQGAVRDETHAEAVGQTRHVFHRGTASLELCSGETWALSGGFEWDTQVADERVASTFAFGLVRWVVGDALTLSALAGSQRGGVKCLAGVCRLTPPFAGARLDAALRF